MVTENDLQLKNGRSVNLKNLKKYIFYVTTAISCLLKALDMFT